MVRSKNKQEMILSQRDSIKKYKIRVKEIRMMEMRKAIIKITIKFRNTDNKRMPKIKILQNRLIKI